MAGETVWVTEGDDPIRLVFRNEQTARVATSDEDIDVEPCELHPEGTGAELERLRALETRVREMEWYGDAEGFRCELLREKP